MGFSKTTTYWRATDTATDTTRYVFGDSDDEALWEALATLLPHEHIDPRVLDYYDGRSIPYTTVEWRGDYWHWLQEDISRIELEPVEDREIPWAMTQPTDSEYITYFHPQLQLLVPIGLGVVARISAVDFQVKTHGYRYSETGVFLYQPGEFGSYTSEVWQGYSEFRHICADIRAKRFDSPYVKAALDNIIHPDTV